MRNPYGVSEGVIEWRIPSQLGISLASTFCRHLPSSIGTSNVCQPARYGRRFPTPSLGDRLRKLVTRDATGAFFDTCPSPYHEFRLEKMVG